MSLSFLGQKSFHPSAPQNVRKLFLAEQKKEQEAKRFEELKREHEQEETRRHARSLLDKKAAAAEPPSSTAFMYQLPPGLKEAQEKRARQVRAREGDAEAAAQKTFAERDGERFEVLKNAPRDGAYANDVAVRHRPFGVAIRNTKCSRCGEWGHQAGDRECSLRHEVAPLDEARKQQDDPMARAVAGAEASGARLRWEPKAAPEMGVHGGAGADDANQQFVAAADDEELLAAAAAASAMGPEGGTSLADLDPAVLALLSERQQRKLLKLYRKELDEAHGDEGGHESRHESKRKRKKHHSKKEKREKEKRDKKEKRRKHGDSKRERHASDGSSSDSDDGTED